MAKEINCAGEGLISAEPWWVDEVILGSCMRKPRSSRWLHSWMIVRIASYLFLFHVEKVCSRAICAHSFQSRNKRTM